jgi:hypothetical protein
LRLSAPARLRVCFHYGRSGRVRATWLRLRSTDRTDRKGTRGSP